MSVQNQDLFQECLLKDDWTNTSNTVSVTLKFGSKRHLVVKSSFAVYKGMAFELCYMSDLNMELISDPRCLSIVNDAY